MSRWSRHARVARIVGTRSAGTTTCPWLATCSSVAGAGSVARRSHRSTRWFRSCQPAGCSPRLRLKDGAGSGGVMLMGMLGTFLGIPLPYLTMLLGSLGGSLIAGCLYVASARFRHDYPWPYGTFLAIAALYLSWGGKGLLGAYLHWPGF